VTILGIPWWSVAVIVAAAVIGSLAGRSIGRARARRAAEKKAQLADADHEGAKTRHEGGP
jgi:membrane protein YqaA with SNARE-associated domain